MRIITYYIYLQNDCRFFTYESCYSSFLLLLVHQNKTLNPSNPSLWFSPSSLMNDARDTMHTFTTMCLLLVLVSKHIQTMKKITVKEIERYEMPPSISLDWHVWVIYIHAFILHHLMFWAKYRKIATIRVTCIIR